MTAVTWLITEIHKTKYIESDLVDKALEMEKQQAERMYSEEDLKLAYNEGQVSIINASYIRTEEWFKKFKKK